MKSIKLTLALLITAGTLFVSCKKETENGKTEITASTKEVANAETTSFTIEGMTCAVGCAKTIETKLAGLDGVQKATVDFDKKTATIQYDAAVQTPEKLVETVEAVADGKTYKVSNVKSSGDKAMFYQEKPKKKAKKEDKSAVEASTTATPAAASCTPKAGEKKAGCCAGKKACASEKKEAGVL
ncbi:heavy-metal-associated domain-containing protein [Flavobacterium sp.]|uniref:heavy-metal-associated domain-containing protein n=1 Tax=Flavobacterium sp. TaxID=239 RepID=UPI003D6AE258